MTLKDLVDVSCGNDHVNIYRDVFQVDSGSTDCVMVYDGSCRNIPEMIYPLKVVSLEPTSVGFNVDVEPMTFGEV